MAAFLPAWRPVSRMTTRFSCGRGVGVVGVVSEESVGGGGEARLGLSGSDPWRARGRRVCSARQVGQGGRSGGGRGWRRARGRRDRFRDRRTPALASRRPVPSCLSLLPSTRPPLARESEPGFGRGQWRRPSGREPSRANAPGRRRPAASVRAGGRCPPPRRSTLPRIQDRGRHTHLEELDHGGTGDSLQQRNATHEGGREE